MEEVIGLVAFIRLGKLTKTSKRTRDPRGRLQRRMKPS